MGWLLLHPPRSLPCPSYLRLLTGSGHQLASYPLPLGNGSDARWVRLQLYSRQLSLIVLRGSWTVLMLLAELCPTGALTPIYLAYNNELHIEGMPLKSVCNCTLYYYIWLGSAGT
jgi:hypothetical protein